MDGARYGVVFKVSDEFEANGSLPKLTLSKIVLKIWV
jgi:hypothetical protein